VTERREQLKAAENAKGRRERSYYQVLWLAVLKIKLRSLCSSASHENLLYLATMSIREKALAPLALGALGGHDRGRIALIKPDFHSHYMKITIFILEFSAAF
jgi:hypothetical protein